MATPSVASTRTSTSSNAIEHFQDSNVGADEFEAWGTMEENYFDAPSDNASKEISKSSGTANPFDDGGEPDFAGWLAAQAQKKPGSGKALPKGLSKPSSARPSTASRTPSSSNTSVAKKAAPSVSTTRVKAAPAKKIDTAPKATEDDDEWGEGW
ncbi:hypothetical protein B7463_g11009, partial [Scytalidium lignicola]